MTVLAAQERDRARVDEKYRWNLAEIYPDAAAWRAEKARLTADLPKLRAYAGRLGSSAQTLADALDLMMRLDRDLSRLYTYASMLSDEDTRLSGPLGMQQEMQQLHADFSAEASYAQPEILRVGSATIERFLAAEPRLEVYAFMLRDIARRAAHTLSDAEEKLLADAMPLSAAAGNIYGILANADFPYPAITLSDGRTRKVDQAGYADLRTVPQREDRRAAMSAFFGALGAFGRTFGTTMNANVQKSMFYARARKYASTLEAALDRPHIPVSVYTRLIDGVNRNLPTFHRYLRLRRRMMGIAGDLHYYDLYAPLVASVNLRYTPEEAQQLVASASAPLGAEYVSVLRRAFAERWLDWYPVEGKRSGAYSNGAAYDVHPYILLNYLGQYNDVSTLAHELGHTMHSYYSNRTQPYATADYPIFVAEVASIFNEALLIDYMLRTITDGPTRLSLLGNHLESIKATVFRQTQFAEFELRMHETAFQGQPITGEALAALYVDITRRYYGQEQGVLVVDEDVAHEWSYIPHFYSDFYVFQYATSFTAAEMLAARVLAGDTETTRRYLAFISSGGSNYPIDLLREAGVDMTSDEPLDVTMRTMNRIMDEIEAMLGS
ncbi:MAG: oligoendopeptidase F [Acidobacteria bacterium RIFCSPLOWO2_12_FULL_67_14]|nr:MAG: oligoendopeptidase F [Acidobacteria bacterium RIFCSPLOWO2_02_FULL_67_21]OFW37941.1 MAG: oligoendopeptidase F [Acidobacteria bacterium RIFCSPLOWO2_12_FULL_67_14]